MNMDQLNTSVSLPSFLSFLLPFLPLPTVGCLSFSFWFSVVFRFSSVPHLGVLCLAPPLSSSPSINVVAPGSWGDCGLRSGTKRKRKLSLSSSRIFSLLLIRERRWRRVFWSWVWVWPWFWRSARPGLRTRRSCSTAGSEADCRGKFHSEPDFFSLCSESEWLFYIW